MIIYLLVIFQYCGQSQADTKPWMEPSVCLLECETTYLL